MGSAAWLTSALEAADAATQALGLTENVQHEAFISPSGGFGVANYGAPVSRAAVVSRQPGRRTKRGGQEVSYRATVAFPRELAIDPRDRITLWDGITGPIVDIDDGSGSPDTGRPCAVTVFLGGGR